jgi:hypothetical protein
MDATDPAAPIVAGETPLSFSPAYDQPNGFALDPSGTLALVPVSRSTAVPGPDSFELLTAGSSMLAPSGLAPALQDPVWRALFVQGRVYALTEFALSVFDVTQVTSPQQTARLAFSSNVLAAVAMSSTIAELSSSWTGVATTDVRLLPIAKANDAPTWAAAPSIALPGTMPEVFASGSLLYVSTTSGVEYQGSQSSQQITVVDTSSGAPVKRGAVSFPTASQNDPYGPYSTSIYNWFTGRDVVQVGPTTLALRQPDVTFPLRIVDLAKPDAPTAVDLAVKSAGIAWWGNLQVVGGSLYVTIIPAGCATVTYGCLVHDYLVPVDVSDPGHPSLGAPISVPGLLFGSAPGDPSTLYFSDYQWAAQNVYPEWVDAIDVCKLSGGSCTLEGKVNLATLMGAPFVQNGLVYASVSSIDQIDLTNAQSPVDRTLPSPFPGFGPLLAVSGNTAFVSSGWGGANVDAYELAGSGAPVYVATLPSELVWQNVAPWRQGGVAYVATGIYGVQTVKAP